MSNKNYNQILQTNNTSLEDIITQLNNLPDAGEGGIDTSDATAAAADILAGKTAYVDGNKITGTFTIDNELSTQDNLISQIQAAADSLPEVGEGELTLINFTIQYGDSNSPTVLNCQAENGMTLGSWIFSAYNNISSMSYGSYTIDAYGDVLFIFAAGSSFLMFNDTKANAFNVIYPNGVYTATYTISGDFE